MEVKLTNRVTMLKTVSAYMEENKTVWNTMAPLQTAMTDFAAALAHIDADSALPDGRASDTIYFSLYKSGSCLRRLSSLGISL